MGWNGSDGVRTARPKAVSPGISQSKRRESHWRGPLAGLVVALSVGIAVYFLFPRSVVQPPEEPTAAPSSNKVIRTSVHTTEVVSDEKRHMRERIEEVVSDKVKDFITKSPTNKVQWLRKPIAPDDPDRALMNRVCAEIGTLLASEPGEVMIPWPYTFLDEDAARARGEKVEGDGGTKEFLDSLKKFRIAVKEGDSDERIAFKEKMVSAQAELLEGIDEGVSVNDAIRAAYEFRKQAYELRSTAIKTMREFLEGGDTVDNTREVLREMNEQLKDKGIKTISEDEIGIEEDSETQETEANQ